MERRTEEIKRFCLQFYQFCDNVTAEARALKGMAKAAESSLKDNVGKKAISKVEEFSDELIKIACQGEERIRELDRKNIKMEENVKDIEEMIR